MRFDSAKNKLLATTILFSSVFLMACTGSTNSFFYAYDRGDCLTTRFDEPDDNLDIRPEWKYDTLYLRWDQYEGDEFNGYYIVRTEGDTNTCPYFYIGGDYYEYIGRKTQTYFKDDDVESGDLFYYRICTKISNSAVDCGAVKKISVY